MKLLFTLIFVSLIAGGLWFVNLYTCPHFLVFPPSSMLAEQYINENFENANIMSSRTSCGQGSDDEIEIVDVEFYPNSLLDSPLSKYAIHTDFEQVPFSPRRVVEVSDTVNNEPVPLEE